MARRPPPRKLSDMRDEAEAAERHKQKLDEELGGSAEDEDEEDDDAEVEIEDIDGGDEAEASDDEEDAPKPKKKAKAKPKAKAPAKPRTRAVKVVRKKLVWVVRDNSSKVVETFPFNQREAAEALIAEKMSGEKKNVFYLQREKVDME